MIYSLPLIKIRIAALFALSGIVLASCGSYQSASYYDNDGIYDSDDQVTTERPQRQKSKKEEVDNDAYANYFGQQANQYQEALDSEIFTDIDSYSSTADMENDSIPEDQLTDYYDNGNDYAGYAAWGDNATDVTINVYDNSWGWGGFGFGSPWLYNSYGWGGYGLGWGGYYNPVWRYGYRPWGYGYRPWGWGGYYGYGYAGYYGGYGTWVPHYGYYHGYHNRYYGYNNYGQRSYAHNATRRGYYRNTNAITGNGTRYASNTRSNLDRTRSTPRYTANSSRSSANRSSARSSADRKSSTTARRAVSVDRNRSYRTSRSTRATPNYSRSSRSGKTTYRSSSPRSSTARSTAPRSSTYRSSGTRTRSSSGTYRSSSPRNNSSYRSSSSRRSNSGYPDSPLSPCGRNNCP